MKPLRPYQVSAVSALRKALPVHRKVILCMKTGLGKTVVAGHIAHQLAANGKDALFLVHRRELVKQACDTLDAFGLTGEYGILQSGVPESPWAPFQVASIQTLFRRECPWLDPWIIFVDECHHAKARTWQSVIERWPNSMVIGLTATPARLDGKALGDIFNHIVFGPTYHQSRMDLDGPYLANMRFVYDPQAMDLSGIRTRGGDYDRSQMGKRVDAKVIADALHAFERHVKPLGRLQTLFYGVTIEHSMAVAQKFRDAGYEAEHVDGNTHWRTRDELFAKFRDGRIQIVCNVDIASEGADFPDCRVVLDGQPTKSVVRYVQKGGRCLRPNADGEPSIYVDLAGNWQTLGLPDEEREYSLEGSGQGQTKEVLSPGSRYRVCNACATAFSRSLRECPACGADAPVGQQVNEVERELVVAPEQHAANAIKATRQLRRDLARIVRKHGRGARARHEVSLLREAHGFSQRWEANTVRMLGL